MPDFHQFTGSATLYSDDENFQKKEGLPIRFKARFDALAWKVRASDFDPVEIEGVISGSFTFTLVVTLDDVAKGSFDKVQGRLSIAAVFEFNPDVPLVPSSILEITLDGERHVLKEGAVVEGKPYNPTTGAVALAGIGEFITGTMKGKQCAIQLDGEFSPPP